MKLVVLSDAKAMLGCEAEHGLSFLIEVDNQRTLFDAGASDVFLKNARVLGMDLNGLDRVVLSHGHWDHGNGLQYLDNLPLVCHPGCFVTRYRKSGRENLGITLSKAEIEAKFELRTSRKALKLSENLYFLGEIPRINDFESRTTKYLLIVQKNLCLLNSESILTARNSWLDPPFFLIPEHQFICFSHLNCETC